MINELARRYTYKFLSSRTTHQCSWKKYYRKNSSVDLSMKLWVNAMNRLLTKGRAQTHTWRHTDTQTQLHINSHNLSSVPVVSNLHSPCVIFCFTLPSANCFFSSLCKYKLFFSVTTYIWTFIYENTTIIPQGVINA